MSELKQAVIISAVRTATGKFLGSLKDFSATQLGAMVVREAVRVGAHVGGEGRAVAPARDHDQLAGVAVGLPHLEVDEPVGVVDEADAGAEGANQRVGALGRDAEA